MAGRAITGVARYALRRGGVTRLPTTNEVRLTDEGARRSVGTHLDGIDARIGHQSAGQHEVLRGQSARVFIGGVDLHRDEEGGAGLAAHVLQNLTEYATAPPLVSAVAVGAMIQQRTDALGYAALHAKNLLR